MQAEMQACVAFWFPGSLFPQMLPKPSRPLAAVILLVSAETNWPALPILKSAALCSVAVCPALSTVLASCKHNLRRALMVCHRLCILNSKFAFYSCFVSGSVSLWNCDKVLFHESKLLLSFSSFPH